MTDISKDKIDITMTAVLRPSILSETLMKIKQHVCRNEEDRYRLIINIDPIGEDIDPVKVVKVAQKNFKNVVFNIADQPSFPKAVKWVWSKVEAPFVFHIEDDWSFNKEIDVDKMINILKNNEKLSSLRLYKYNNENKKRISVFNCIWVYKNDGFYLAKDWKKQFGLNPILIKKEFILQALPNMKDDVNPEKQFRESQEYMRSVIKEWSYGLYCKPGETASVSDIGRNWIKNTKFTKPKNETFLTWIKK